MLQITLTGKQTHKRLCLEHNRKLFCFSTFDVASFLFVQLVVTASVYFRCKPSTFSSWNNPYPTTTSVISDGFSSGDRSDIFLQPTSKITDFGMETGPFTDMAPFDREPSTQMSTSVLGYTVKFQGEKYYLGKIFKMKIDSLPANTNAAVCSAQPKLNRLESGINAKWSQWYSSFARLITRNYERNLCCFDKSTCTLYMYSLSNTNFASKIPFDIKLLKPTGHVMHQQFNIQQLYALPTLYLCVLYLSQNKQRLVPLTA